MKEILSRICLIVFALLPVVVLGLRVAFPRRMPWWAVVLIAVAGGWAVALVSAMLNEGPESGAGHVGALFFGWAIAFLWFLPWWILYGVVQLVRQWSARSPAQKMGSAERT
jgi:hypothetical protein